MTSSFLEIRTADNSMDEKELEKLIKDTGYIEIDKTLSN